MDSIDNIDHDQLFKTLLSTFFLEFLDLFLPHIASTLDRTTLHFKSQEFFTDIPLGERKRIDLLAEVHQAGDPVGFLVHVEAQASVEQDFARRMFFYFAHLHRKYLKRVYPIVVFSFDQPYRAEPHRYTVQFPGLTVVDFQFIAIQLNRLHWRDYLSQANPVAAALMAKMRIDPADRPKVKAECLRLLVTLKLDPARTKLISGFVDTYLKLNAQEQQAFQAEIDKLEPQEQEGYMEIVTSWMEQGERSLALRILTRKFGELPATLRSRIDALTIDQLNHLGEDLLDFQALSDLETWLAQQSN